MTSSSQYRSRGLAGQLIAFSVSYEPENLAARGLGFEHLNELLIRLARPLLRHGADLAYGGNWVESDDNFTYALLRLIAAEQEDTSLGASGFQVGRLYNHSAWPHYLRITPRLEAQWINCCRVVRITQELAGIAAADIVPDEDVATDARTPFNAAVTGSAMRRSMMQPMRLPVADAADERIPPVAARILLGGKVTRYAGFLPGIFEEAMLSLRHKRPTYLLGGFGGASEILARAILAAGTGRPDELTLAWHEANTPGLADLIETSRQQGLPAGLAGIEKSLDDLFALVLQARDDPATLNTGLEEPAQVRELLTTSNVATAVHLVRTGLAKTNNLKSLPA
jgi:hypothetical protein